MFFFFSSRRRHTRWNCDWSSDVCSSDLVETLGRDRAERLDTMIYDVIVASYGKPDVTMSPEVLDATNALRKFMFDNVYLSGPAKTEDEKAQGVLWELLQYFEAHPERMPAERSEERRVGK